MEGVKSHKTSIEDKTLFSDLAKSVRSFSCLIEDAPLITESPTRAPHGKKLPGSIINAAPQRRWLWTSNQHLSWEEVNVAVPLPRRCAKKK